ncbi:MAG: hypothetical protein E7313_08275 [Clostridiales bacterium]|nr:hypothetical protein [Clostridiales bacterium]
MDNKEELKKQLLMLSIILIIVIIFAVLINKEDGKNNKSEIKNNQEIVTEDEKILDNLKGLLKTDETNEEYIQEEIEGENEKTITTNSGETVIVRE